MFPYDFSIFPIQRDVDIFRMHYEYKNPIGTRGFGIDGISDHQLPEAYAQGLHAASRDLVDRGWARPEGLIKVYLMEPASLVPVFTDPFTYPDHRNDLPVIILPAQQEEPVSGHAMKKAFLDAKHEAVHAMNYRYRPWKTDSDWHWIDEATCTYMEILEGYSKPDWLRWAHRWINCPEISIDDHNNECQQGFLLHYLEDKYPGFIQRLWTEGSPGDGESPLEGISRALNGTTFASADSEVEDVFASQYCVDSYFVHQLFPDVAQRYGERTLAWFVGRDMFSPGNECLILPDQIINHLACKYYRFDLPEGIQQITFQIESPAITHSDCPLKAITLLVSKNDAQMLNSVPDTRFNLKTSFSQKPDLSTLGISIPMTQYSEIDHVVLTVVNCGLSKQSDNVPFQIRAYVG